MAGMNPRLLLLAVAVLAWFAVPVVRAQEAVLERRTGAAAKKILKRSDKVIIAGFRVAFNLEGSASASTDSRLSNLGNSIGSGPRTVTSDAAVSMKVTLAGVTSDEFQRIAEEAYADFKTQLAQAGVTVLGPDVLKASKGYGQLTFTPSSKEKPYARDLSFGAGTSLVVFTPAELPLFLGHYDGGKLGPVTMNLGNWRALNQLSVETRAVVLVPTLVVDFVRMKSSGQRKMLRNDAGVGADPRIALLPQHTNVAVFHAKIRLAGELGGFHLGEDLVVPGAFGTLKQVSAADNAALNSSLVMLTGLPGRVSSRSAHVLLADPAAYSRLSLDGVRAFNRAAGDFIAAR